MTIKLQPETIFGRAIEIGTRQERATFLEQACENDTVLRQQVEKLVDDYFRAGDFLEQPLAQIDAPAVAGPIPDLIGTQIGPYKIREQIGEGGMGVVYVAEQTEPVRRKVALKVIKPGMASKDVVNRFEAERQALAMMDHPSIARVLDGGATENGQPYFVMDLVRGLPITAYCDQKELTLRERLGLFQTVCHAVQHAHQKGIIHRDLKPSNVMVSEIDGASVPKMIDFGVAKAINTKLTAQTVYTQFLQMVGTPLYMSPEQAGLGDVDVDTRSDIYSLGVLLYELLSGSTPFDGESLRSVGFDEMRRIIREDQPPRPSAMVSTLNAQALSTAADCRRIDTRSLGNSLSGELDWLVMKALEKDRNRRYESASALAADIERYLEGDAVQACPPSAVYRLRKLSHRYRGIITAAAVVFVVLIGGLAGTSWQAIQATRQKTNTDAALQQAEANLDLALAAVDDMYTNFATQWIADSNAPTTLQHSFLDRARDFYRRVASQPGTSANTRARAAHAYERIAQIEHYLQDYGEAAEALDQAILVGEELASGDPESAKTRSNLVNRYRMRADARLEMANVEGAAQDFAAGLAHLSNLLRLDGDLPKHQLERVHFEHSYAVLLLRKGQIDKAQSLLRRTQKQIRSISGSTPLAVKFYTAGIDNGRLSAIVLWAQGNLSAATEMARNALENCRRLQRSKSSDDLATATVETRLIQLLGQLAEAEGDFAKAVALYREELELKRQGLKGRTDPSQFMVSSITGVSEQDSENEPGRFCGYAETQLRLARALFRLGRPYEAEYNLSRCMLSIFVIRVVDPQVLRYHVTEANTWAMVWQLLSEQRPGEADATRDYSILVWRESLADFPDAASYRGDVHGLQNDLAWFRSLLDEDGAALLDTDDPLPVYDFQRSYPNTAFSWHATGRSWYDAGNFKMAITNLERSAENRGKDRAYPWFHLAMCHAKLGKQDESQLWLKKANAAVDQMQDPPTELIKLREETLRVIRESAESRVK